MRIYGTNMLRNSAKINKKKRNVKTFVFAES